MLGKPAKFKGVKSKDKIVKERYAKEHGGLPNEGKPWTQDDFDKLITFLVWGGGEKEYCKTMGRSWKSFDTYRWKIIDRTQTKGYIPKCLLSREGKVWDELEIWLLKTAISKGWDHEMIARAAGRTVNAITDKLQDLQQTKRPSFGLV